MYLQSLGHDEEGEGEAEADDEDTGNYEVSQEPPIQGQWRLQSRISLWLFTVTKLSLAPIIMCLCSDIEVNGIICTYI